MQTQIDTTPTNLLKSHFKRFQSFDNFLFIFEIFGPIPPCFKGEGQGHLQNIDSHINPSYIDSHN